MYLSADSVKRAKSAFGNKSICAMGIISYPEFAQFIPVKCDFYYCQTDVFK